VLVAFAGDSILMHRRGVCCSRCDGNARDRPLIVIAFIVRRIVRRGDKDDKASDQQPKRYAKNFRRRPKVTRDGSPIWV
jgi:hypothetical protein